MKRLLSYIIMVVIGLSAFSQSPSWHFNFRSAYPLLAGESTVGSMTFSHHGVHLFDVPQDALPTYEIGQIGYQTLTSSTDGFGFYLKADSLHSLNLTYSYEAKEPPMGTIDFNAVSGRFKYYPAYNEYKPIVVTFSATNGTMTISEDVEFNFMPQLPSVSDAFYTEGLLPDAGDYTTIAETSKTQYLNNQYRTAFAVSISGKDVVFDDAVQNNLLGLSGREDIYELNIYAERLIVRSSLYFPQTDITIYAKELIFEDHGNVVASINTTPSPIKEQTDVSGKGGANAGDIRLFIKKFKADLNPRFILNGGKGQSSNRNGTPGNGGNGGTLSSTIDLSAYCDVARGSGGVKYDVASDGSTNPGAIIGYGTTGQSGSFQLMDKPYAYLHPYYIAAVLRHANDAFINNCTSEVLETCREYRDIINEYLNSIVINDDGNGGNHDGGNGGNHEGILDDLDDLLGVKRMSVDVLDDLEWALEDYDSNERIDLRCELQSNLLEFNAMLLKLEQGLDYFGNPVGWVPMLSFEVYMETYNKEIDRAIKTLYLYNWLNKIDLSLQNKITISGKAADATEEAIADNIESLNSLTREVPVLQDEAQAMTNRILDLTHKIEVLQNQLMAKAQKNVKKRNLFQKIFNIAKTVVSFIPVVGPAATVVKIASGVVGAVGMVSKLFKKDVDVTQVSDLLSSAGTNPIDFPQMIADVRNTLQGINLTQNMGSNIQQLSKSFSSISETIKPLESAIANVYDVMSKNTAPNSEVQAEYYKLLASSTEWHKLKNQIDDLNAKKTELLNHIDHVFCDMTTTMADISNNVLALDVFRRDVFKGNSKRDLNAMLYFKKMNQDAESRLLKYDYYLRKAYEYRMLKPYGGKEFNLNKLRKRAEQLALAGDSIIDKSDYEQLAVVYRDDISTMTASIINEFSYNRPSETLTIPIEVSAEQLEAINRGESVRMNFFEMGIFPPEYENIRIVNLGVSDLQTHVVGNTNNSTYMSLNMVHSGISQFRKNGKLYWFNHLSRNTMNPHTWGVMYYPSSNRTELIQPSGASKSLIYSLLGGNNDKIMLFSQPSAWSDVSVSKAQQGNIVIDKLVLNLEYDFTRRSENYRNINIRISDDLYPYIACSVLDISECSDGVGQLYRTYPMSNQSVTFSAQEDYEAYHFINWTDNSGNIVSDKPDLTVQCMTDQVYIANYERWVPILEVPSTIKVSPQGGTHSVHVANIGQGDVKMDWYVNDSLSSWVHLNDNAEGIDEGSFTFTFDANKGTNQRTDSLEIIAPETDGMSKTIYIVQDIDPNIQPNLLYTDAQEVIRRQQFVLPIQMKNEMNVVGVQFDLYLPTGMMPCKDEYGDYKIALSNRTTSRRHSIAARVQEDGALRIVISSTENATFKSNSGAMLYVTCLPGSQLTSGIHEIELKNVVFTDSEANRHKAPDLKGYITVADYTMGDVNNDGHVDVADLAGVVRFILEIDDSHLIFRTADMDGSGRVEINDYSALVNVILNEVSFNSSMKLAPSRAHYSKAVELVATQLDGYGHAELQLQLMNTDRRYTGLQFDFQLPEGIELMEDGILPECHKHEVYFVKVDKGKYRVLNSSTSNSELTAGIILRLRVKATSGYVDAQEMVISNILLSDVEAVCYKAAPTAAKLTLGSQTGVFNIRQNEQKSSLYDVQGRNVLSPKSGVYIIKGKKVLIK